MAILNYKKTFRTANGLQKADVLPSSRDEEARMIACMTHMRYAIIEQMTRLKISMCLFIKNYQYTHTRHRTSVCFFIFSLSLKNKTYLYMIEHFSTIQFY